MNTRKRLCNAMAPDPVTTGDGDSKREFRPTCDRPVAECNGEHRWVYHTITISWTDELSGLRVSWPGKTVPNNSNNRDELLEGP